MRTRPNTDETEQERFERLKAFAAQLVTKTDCPLMREKIANIVETKSVNH
jgi:hypothetical protein